MSIVLTVVAVAAYALAAIGPADADLNRRRVIAALLAVVAHGTLVLSPWLDAAGVRLGLAAALSMITWQSAVILLLFLAREPVGALARWVFAAAGVGTLAAALAADNAPRVILDGWLLTSHVAASVLAYGLLTLAAMQALALWARNRHLHAATPGDGPATRVPIQTMERVLFQMIGLGFALLTISLVSGVLVTRDVMGQHLAHKLVFTLAAWIVFAALLLGRWRLGWRGRTATRWALSGYGVLALAYFGAKWVLESLMDTHWG